MAYYRLHSVVCKFFIVRVQTPIRYDNKNTPFGAFLFILAESKGLSDSLLRHTGAKGPLSLRKIQTAPNGLFSHLSPRTLQSQIANASSTLRFWHKNKTPTKGCLIFVAESKGFEPLIPLRVYYISNVAH